MTDIIPAERRTGPEHLGMATVLAIAIAPVHWDSSLSLRLLGL